MHATAIIPQLRTTDLDASIRFYTEVLGLQLAFKYRDFYAGICAGEHTFHLKLIDQPDPSIAHVRAGGHVHLYIEVDGVAAAAAELKAKGVALCRDVHETPWQTREIVLEDDQGHTLYLFENI
ncbi:MAG: VOC family protein [Deltaproteobacteria bacterium]|nr:VOC family protein [Deltaproteobacteria bacterium]